MRYARTTWLASGLLLLATLSGAAGTFLVGGVPLPTTLEAFFQPGSQPNGDVVFDEFLHSDNCQACHGSQPGGVPGVIVSQWKGSMMGQTARDPIFYAALAVAEADSAFIGDLCLRCHTPGAWISGRSEPTDGSALLDADRDGVNCHICHRMVDPVYKPTSPIEDFDILANIDPLPINPGGGNYILDPSDRRRGPYEFEFPDEPPHDWLASPYHQTAALCGTCHDVSNPAFLRQEDGTYVLTDPEEAHPTADKYDMFPMERTYSEWLNSDFANGGVDMGGRFGGEKAVVSTCQDCHMPDTIGQGSVFPNSEWRDDLASHDFAGGNARVQDMILNLYPDDGLDAAAMEAGKQAAVSMLERASTLELTQEGNYVNVRLVNETGHKLPTGYPEGRRMWINVEFRDDVLSVIEERGRYETLTASLTTEDTKVYEVKLGMDEAMAVLTGFPVGESFHFALNNVVIKDNRIPPRGFVREAFAAVQAAPIGAAYTDGQYWDDTRFRMPTDADSVTVNVYYQTISKEFVEFLRDAVPSHPAGQTLYDQWVLTGKSSPVLMASDAILLDPFADGDFDVNGVVDLRDYLEQNNCATGPAGVYENVNCSVFDFDEDDDIDLRDYFEFQLSFSG